MDFEYFMDKMRKVDPNKRISYKFDMNLVDAEEGDGNFQRLLQVDQRLIIPVGVPVRLLITSADVLHSFAVPALGIKVDAIPGRLSSFMVFVDRPGVFFGQCSELCGPMHGFMPIVIEAVSVDSFIEYALSNEESGLEIINKLPAFQNIRDISDEEYEAIMDRLSNKDQNGGDKKDS